MDTWSPWLYNTVQVRAVTDLMKHLADTPDMQQMVPIMPQGGSVPFRCRRFINGYALDHSEFPCYLLWSCRNQEEYWLVDTMTMAPSSCPQRPTFNPWGCITSMMLFALEGKANLRQDALVQFRLAEEELTSDLRLTATAVLRMQWS